MSFRGTPSVDPADRHEQAAGGHEHWRYRVFFVLSDEVEGRCELRQNAPISLADVDAVERELIGRLGCGNALVIGWQQLLPPSAVGRA